MTEETREKIRKSLPIIRNIQKEVWEIERVFDNSFYTAPELLKERLYALKGVVNETTKLVEDYLPECDKDSLL